jgi:hypothetical protein
VTPHIFGEPVHVAAMHSFPVGGQSAPVAHWSPRVVDVVLDVLLVVVLVDDVVLVGVVLVLLVAVVGSVAVVGLVVEVVVDEVGIVVVG